LPPTGLAQFNGSAALSDGQTINTWSWNFNDPNATGANPNTSNIQNPTHTYSGNGIYNVMLTVTSSGGCSGDTTLPINFNVKPSLAYPVLSSVCVNATATTVNVATATVTNTAVGTGQYNGPGTSAAGIFTPAIAGVGTHTIWYKFTTPNGCVDSISQTILVKAKPVVSYTYPLGGCLPPTGLAQFNGSAALSDGQTINTWSWNFNDPNATGANPNTSSIQNPTHNFTANGIYNVVLTVLSSGGCSGDTTLPLNFNLKPSLAFATIAPVCQSVVGTISVANASVTNGATGTGVYYGTSTTSAGQFSPSASGAGTFTIWYKFTTPNGCVDSISQTVTVQPKPVASFVKTDVCITKATTFTSTSNIGAGSIGNWYWDFGDATTANYTNANPFTKTYTTPGTYIVKHVATSTAGCISDTVTQTITVYEKPVPNFTLPNSVCMPGNAVNITNTSSIPGNGILTYNWQLGDGNTSIATSPSHTYATIGNYTIKLYATSINGCVDSTTKTFNAFFVKPIALFTTNKDTLCQGVNSVFTNASTDPMGSLITNYNWAFGDGTTSTLQNPTKLYNTAQSYTASLTVINAAGCVSNPFTKNVVVAVQPVIDAGPAIVVPLGSSVMFSGTANSVNGVVFAWSPANVLTNANTLTPTHIATADRTFTLTATSTIGNCTASDVLTVKVLKPVSIPNAFSPNGDGINDRWVIENLPDYADCMVAIFNRYGQKIYEQKGYSNAWDGTVNGKPMPLATYYYVIDLKNGFTPLKGSITIIK
jgi:gliding motility-associated-like protein